MSPKNGCSLSLCLVLLIPAACASVPPIELRAEHGVVRAHRQSDAEAVAKSLERAPELRARLESSRDDPIEVWVMETATFDDSLAGITDDGIILLGTEAMNQLTLLLTHELTHWFVEESPYETLPMYVQEGLADWVSLDAVGLVDLRARETAALGGFTVHSSLLYLDREGWSALGKKRREPLTRVGTEVVRVLGLETLREMAARKADAFEYADAARAAGGLTIDFPPAD